MSAYLPTRTCRPERSAILSRDPALEVGQGESVHEGGLVGVARPPVRIHVEDELITVAREQPAPDPLQARGVVGLDVELRVPGDGLGAARVARPAEPVDDGVDLVDRPALDLVGEQALVVGVGPLALLGRDPVVVDAVDDLLAVDLEVLEPAREGAVEPRLEERVFDDPHHGAVPAGRVAGLVVFGRGWPRPVPSRRGPPSPRLRAGSVR